MSCHECLQFSTRYYRNNASFKAHNTLVLVEGLNDSHIIAKKLENALCATDAVRNVSKVFA